MICAVAFLTSSCSNENDNIISPSNSENHEGFTTITVGAPTINYDAATTRMAFEYNNGLELTWTGSEYVRMRGWHYDSKWIQKDIKSTTITPSVDRKTASITYNGSFDTQTVYSAVIAPSESGCTNLLNSWETGFNFATEQTQSGNGNTSHLASNYVAIIKYVSSDAKSGFSFTNSWASNHAYANSPSKTAVTDSLGFFQQSACLKLDLTLPVQVKQVKKVVLVADNNIFKTKNNGSQVTNTLTLNFSDISSDETYQLIGYIMLAAATTDFSNTTLAIKVYTGDGDNDYIYRTLTFGSGKALQPGTLGVITLKNTGWLNESIATTWTFDSFTTNDVLSTTSVYSYDNDTSSDDNILLYISGHSAENGAKIQAVSGNILIAGKTVPYTKSLYIPGGNTSSTVGRSVSTYTTDRVAFQAPSAGMVYAYMKGTTATPKRYLIIDVNGTQDNTETTGSAQLVSKSVAANDNIFMGTSGGAATFYVIKFVPLK